MRYRADQEPSESEKQHDAGQQVDDQYPGSKSECIANRSRAGREVKSRRDRTGIERIDNANRHDNKRKRKHSASYVCRPGAEEVGVLN